jgi:hypothetical protein
LRAGSLSQEPALSYIQNHFVCGYRNIYKEPFAGNSSAHPMNAGAVTTTNGAGPHNVQIFMLSDDGTVLHCLPGYWDPQDLVSELALAEKLNQLWKDRSMQATDKAAAYKKLQLEHLAMHSQETTARSHLQGFDAMYIAHHAKALPDLIEKPQAVDDYERQSRSVAIVDGEKIHPYLAPDALKTTDKIMHERMSKMPFTPYEKFNIASFTNYGTQFYDKNENELEGKFAHLEWKRLDLKKVTTDAEGTAREQKTTAASCKSASCSFEPAKPMTEQDKLMERFETASKLLHSHPHNVAALESRADAAYNLKMYQQAYSDAGWAAYYGSRSATNAHLRMMAERAIASQPAATNKSPLIIQQSVSAKRLMSDAHPSSIQ